MRTRGSPSSVPRKPRRASPGIAARARRRAARRSRARRRTRPCRQSSPGSGRCRCRDGRWRRRRRPRGRTPRSRAAAGMRRRCLEQDADHRRGEDRVAGPPPVAVAAASVDPADGLGVEADPGREAEAPPVDPAERDRDRPAGLERLDRLGRRRRPGRAGARARAGRRSPLRRGRSRTGSFPAAPLIASL